MYRLRASHRTEIRYRGDAHESVNHVRLLPSSGPTQHVLASRISVFPEAAVCEYRDAYRNRVAWFQISGPHRRLVVEATAEVAPLPAPAAPDRAGTDDFSALADPAYRDRRAEYLATSPMVRWDGIVADFAEDLALGPKRAIEPWLIELEAAIGDSLAYTPGATAVDTPIERAIEMRRGVCQDMAHVFIALGRRAGVATRYVSGWLHQGNAEAPAESHAWAEAFVPGRGWIQFDPTHPNPRLSDYIRVGSGRDYADAAPVRGSYVGPGAESMKVTVSVVSVEEPDELEGRAVFVRPNGAP